MPNVYLRRGEKLVAMREQPYEAEVVLQELLAAHPELLTDDAESRALLFVRREAPLSDSGEQFSAGSLDHLFVDRDGVPTLVEVKRSSDARIRREVVGQILDYAANASACWQDDTVRRWFDERCAAQGLDPTDLLMATFPELDDVEQYWSQVRTNLTAGRLRLVFVADAIPIALRRIIEFLNGQMHQTEVIAVEVKQYVDLEGLTQTIVPQVLGRTEAARQVKGRRPARRWNPETVLAAVLERQGSAAADVAAALVAWASERGLQPWFGSGTRDGSFKAGLEDGRRYLWPFTLYTNGLVEICFQPMAARPPFDDRARREQLRLKLNEIPGVDLPESSLDRRPSFRMDALVPPVALDQFIATMDWAFAQCTSVAMQ